MPKIRAIEIFRALQSNFSVPRVTGVARDPFQTLIRTVLSQNTADINTMRAFRNLSEKFPVNPEGLAEADLKEIEKAITVAGLYRNKSRVVKNLSRLILERFDGSLNFIFSLPLEDARKKAFAYSRGWTQNRRCRPSLLRSKTHHSHRYPRRPCFKEAGASPIQRRLRGNTKSAPVSLPAQILSSHSFALHFARAQIL